MTHPDQDTLHRFAEDGLEDAARAEVAAHVESCAECGDEVRWVRTLRQAAGTLPDAVESGKDLWPGIEAGIRRSSRPPSAPVLSVDTVRRRRAGWRRPLLLAAAAMMLVALSSFLPLSVVRWGADGTGGGVAVGPGAGPGGIEAPDGVEFVSAVEEMERAYGPAIRELEEALELDRERLRPETVRALEENLRIIDEAIAEATAALVADPGSAAAARALNGTYGSKVQMLRQATRLLQGA